MRKRQSQLSQRTVVCVIAVAARSGTSFRGVSRSFAFRGMSDGGALCYCSCALRWGEARIKRLQPLAADGFPPLAWALLSLASSRRRAAASGTAARAPVTSLCAVCLAEAMAMTAPSAVCPSACWRSARSQTPNKTCLRLNLFCHLTGLGV